ncbi:MAG TPA: hypothetical protein DHV48_03445 [Prolixibacteraceae bacterium]|nr:hypothetical protein [Prolixibacteraceae bacterium]
MEPLSQREIQIADLIHKGYIEKEIASELNISFSTVHTHSKNIKTKMGARNIADITRIFLTQIRANAVNITLVILAIIAAFFLQKYPDLLETIKSSLIHFK